MNEYLFLVEKKNERYFSSVSSKNKIFQ